MPLASADVVNAALQMTGENVRVSGSDPNYDNTTLGLQAGVLYRPAVEMLLRQITPEFARTMALLEAHENNNQSAATTWAGEYHYPDDCLRLLALRPEANQISVFSPLPLRGAVLVDPFAEAGPTRVVLSSQVNPIAVYITDLAGVGAEHIWDSGFLEAVTRRLANPLAMAVAGRPDFARELLEESAKFAQMAEMAREL